MAGIVKRILGIMDTVLFAVIIGVALWFYIKGEILPAIITLLIYAAGIGLFTTIRYIHGRGFLSKITGYLRITDMEISEKFDIDLFTVRKRLEEHSKKGITRYGITLKFRGKYIFYGRKTVDFIEKRILDGRISTEGYSRFMGKVGFSSAAELEELLQKIRKIGSKGKSKK